MEELENELIDDRVSLSDRVAALNVPLKSVGVSSEDAAEEIELDQFAMVSCRVAIIRRLCFAIIL